MAKSPIPQSSFKTEGTTKTYGQQIVPEKQSSLSLGQASNVTTVKVLSVSKSKQQSTASSKSDNSAIGDVIVDKTKTQILAAAAANNKTSSTVVVDKEVSKNQPIVEKIVSVVQSSILPKEQVYKGLLESQKVDLSIAVKSKDSDPLEFNTIQAPQQFVKFVYQRWAKNESDVTSQEDPAKDPLLKRNLKNVPRYVELRWVALSAVEQITENDIPKSTEVEKIKSTVLKSSRGVSSAGNNSTTNPVHKYLKNLNLQKSETTKGKIVDIHEPEKAFDSVANKGQFINSISVDVKAKSTQIDSSLGDFLNKLKK